MPEHESFLERVEDVLHIHHKETTTMSTFPTGDPAADKAQADADAAQAAADEAKAAAEAVDATDEEKIAADEAQIRADEAQLAADQAKGTAPAPAPSTPAAEGPGTSVNNPNIPASEPAPPTPPPAPTAADAHAALDTLAAGSPSTPANIDAVATVRAMLPAPEQPAVPAESSVPPVEAPPA